MAKNKPKQPVQPEITLEADQRVDFNCLNTACMAEFCIINEPGRPGPGLAKTIETPHCVFCGSENIERV